MDNTLIWAVQAVELYAMILAVLFQHFDLNLAKFVCEREASAFYAFSGERWNAMIHRRNGPVRATGF